MQLHLHRTVNDSSYIAFLIHTPKLLLIFISAWLRLLHSTTFVSIEQTVRISVPLLRTARTNYGGKELVGRSPNGLGTRY